jgi:alpha-glucosidase
MRHYTIQFIYLLAFLLVSLKLSAKVYQVSSPDGQIVTTINTDDGISWSSTVNGTAVFNQNKISLTVNGDVLGATAKVKKAKETAVSSKVEALVPVKSRTIDNTYNQLTLTFKNDFAVSFRVFNNGVAYRFETSKKGEAIVNDEQVMLNFAGNYPIIFPEEETLLSHYERLYKNETLSSLDEGKFCSLPTLIEGDNNIKIGITEADLFDYPGLFLEATASPRLNSKFPKVILELKPKGDRNITVVKEADYIAKTEGNRTFPWRVFMISQEDKDLVENQMVYLLSRECKIEDPSWIKPGLVGWDWWNDNNLYDVDFKSGIDNQTYKYYIDFASEYGIPYIILDEGWSKTTTNVLESRPEIDIPELVAYGKERNVDLILWSLWGPVDKDMDNILDRFAEWGVKGMKVDFMSQAGQYMVNFYDRIAKACADRKLLVDFHGAYKPSGLRRAYPNVINYEGVKGMENCKWSNVITPEHDVTLPFTRMLAGPMDFTPGAMRNAHPKDYTKSHSNPMSLGTRCHQLAMYVVYDAPLQMLSDSPSNYYKEAECTLFLSQMKTVWDDTKVLDAKVGDYIVTARKSGSDWYIGAMTDDDARTLSIDLSFLESDDYEIEIMQDGINADKAAQDYQHITKKVDKNSKIEIPMASGGGWAAVCRKL